VFGLIAVLALLFLPLREFMSGVNPKKMIQTVYQQWA